VLWDVEDTEEARLDEVVLRNSDDEDNFVEVIDGTLLLLETTGARL
jgi:hypothetical protein